MTCPNIKHNLSWKSQGSVNPCNQLVDFPGHDSVQAMRDSQAYRQLLDAHADDQKPIWCRRCWEKETIGLTSKRQHDISLHDIYQRIDPDYVKIDGAIGQLCNAACRICGPSSSSLWQQLDPSWQITPVSSTIWFELERLKDHVIQMDFGGGEPWVNDVQQQIKLFDQMILSKRSEIVKIRYNTNGSIWPRHLIDRLLRFRELEITISLDDVAERFEYNRWPLKWTVVNDNLDKFLDLQTRHDSVRLTINFTVSVWTWQRADAFQDWANSRGLDRINFNILTNPEIYAIHGLPSVAKNRGTRFDDLVSTRPMPQWWQHFCQINQHHDKQRGQNWQNIFPELLDIR